VQPIQYRVTVRGRLTDRLGSAFEGMTLRFAGGNTDLVGEIRDQSQLFGLLDTIRTLGLELISAIPAQREGPASPAAPATIHLTKEPPT
jgi:hypothetical protein